MSKKKRVKFKYAFALLLILVLALGGTYVVYKSISKINEALNKKDDAYIGSKDYYVDLYDLEYNKVDKLVRGTKVSKYEKKVEQEIDEKNTKEYSKIEYKGKTYLVPIENTTDKYENSVYEKEKFVRTSLTIYEKTDDILIAGYAKKGTKLETTGFDKINEDGTINMYKIKNDKTEGYVYSKYLVDTVELANENYNENGIYDIHKDRKYSYELYGGKAANLDYYPYEKKEFEDNKFVDNAKAYYLVGSPAVINSIDKYIELAKKAKATAFVVDIKDGALAYKSDISNNYTSTSYNTAMNSKESYKAAIDKIKAANFYVIGRIVLFNDPTYAKDNPSDCIYTNGGKSTNWVSAYSRKAWEYNIRLALESIQLFDFNEIQFDYVRFPEASFNWSKQNYDFKNKYSEEKAQALQTFLYYAADEIHKTNTYLSVDVFGESAGTYVTAYGQYFPAISNIVDVISGMPYTDHFERNDSSTWKNPYNTMNKWGKLVQTRQKEIPTPAKVRTWITAYNVPFWNPTITYGANEIYQQVKGLSDAGIGSGFMTWNANSNYTKYQSIAEAFSKEY